MEVLSALPEAAPILLRHAAAYAELVGEDFARAQRDLSKRIVAGVVVGVSAVFVLGLICLAVIARTWDTPHRSDAIAWLGVVFLVAGIVAALVRGRMVRSEPPFLAAVKAEWHQDRIVLERILHAAGE
jgi:uncharacterized membrane protein YqjE